MKENHGKIFRGFSISVFDRVFLNSIAHTLCNLYSSRSHNNNTPHSHKTTTTSLHSFTHTHAYTPCLSPMLFRMTYSVALTHFLWTIICHYSEDYIQPTEEQNAVLEAIWKYPIFGLTFEDMKDTDTAADDEEKGTAKDNRMRLVGFVCLVKMLHQASMLPQTSDEMDTLIELISNIEDSEWFSQLFVNQRLLSTGVVPLLRAALKIIPFFCKQVNDNDAGNVSRTRKTTKPPEGPQVVVSKPNLSFFREKGNEHKKENKMKDDQGRMPNAYQMEIAAESTLFMLMMDAGVLKERSNIETFSVDETDNDSVFIKQEPGEETEELFCNCVQPPVNAREQTSEASTTWEKTYGSTDSAFNAIGTIIHTMLYSRRSKQVQFQTKTDAFDPAAKPDDPTKPQAHAKLLSSAVMRTSRMMDCMAVAQTVTVADAKKFYRAMVSVTGWWWWCKTNTFQMVHVCVGYLIASPGWVAILYCHSNTHTHTCICCSSLADHG